MAIILNSFLYPITLILECTFLLFIRVTHNPGIAIIGVSLVVSILCLPLYAKAEAWQNIERTIRTRLKPKTDEIKAVFKGDERMMILSTYYRQNKYHPIYALRGSVGVLLQIPFFIAAYSFLSHLNQLEGASFFILKDLSKPDALLYGYNLLPVVMTLINLASAFVYAKDLDKKEKVQLFVLPLLFLLLLYKSPSGLVLYWTCNNLFSLGKNLSYKTKKPLLVLYGLILLGTGTASLAVLFVLDTTIRKRMLVLALSAILIFMPLLVSIFVKILSPYRRAFSYHEHTAKQIFFTSIFMCFVLMGLYIPLNLIASSPQEFSFLGKYSSPFYFIIHTTLQALSFFMLWPSIIFFLYDSRIKKIMSVVFACISVSALIQVFIFKGNYGTISKSLVFPDAGLLKVSMSTALLHSTVIIVVCLFIFFISVKKTKAISLFFSLTALSLISISSSHIFKIQSEYIQLKKIQGDQKTSLTLEPVFTLSSTSQNVLIFMLDRAISSFALDILQTEPHIAQYYNGFTLYPNTLSFGGHTLLGAPPLFGGYDYTPEAINSRPNDTLVHKHNEALSVLPLMFSTEGWNTSISDASWANYSWIPDNSIFKKYEGVKAFNLEGSYTDLWLKEHGYQVDSTKTLTKNLFRFSLFKTLPVFLRNGFYDSGKWWDSDYTNNTFVDFIDMYAVLDYLPELFTIQDSKTSYFSCIVNNTTHESLYLEYPDYVPVPEVENKGPLIYSDEQTNTTYPVNHAALLRLSLLFKKMQEQGAWDTTRIIIVADHGFGLNLPVFKGFDSAKQVSYYNPLLMVKDFNEQGPVKVNNRFSTNADVPYLATENLIPQINPFTKNKLSLLKENETVEIVSKNIYDPSTQSRTKFNYGKEDILRVTENIFNPSNWSPLP